LSLALNGSSIGKSCRRAIPRARGAQQDDFGDVKSALDVVRAAPVEALPLPNRADRLGKNKIEMPWGHC